MARKPAKSTRKKAAAHMVAWNPKVHGELFRLASSEWMPPRHIRVSNQARGLTLDAKFTTQKGDVAALRIRLKRYADGNLGISEETMSFRFYGPKGTAA